MGQQDCLCHHSVRASTFVSPFSTHYLLAKDPLHILWAAQRPVFRKQAGSITGSHPSAFPGPLQQSQPICSVWLSCRRCEPASLQAGCRHLLTNSHEKFLLICLVCRWLPRMATEALDIEQFFCFTTLPESPLLSIVLVWIHLQLSTGYLQTSEHPGCSFYFPLNMFPHLYTARCAARHNSVCQVLCVYCSYRDVSSQ